MNFKLKTFSKVKQGDTFYYHNVPYYRIRTIVCKHGKNFETHYNAINLTNGEPESIGDLDYVTIFESELVDIS